MSLECKHKYHSTLNLNPLFSIRYASICNIWLRFNIHTYIYILIQELRIVSSLEAQHKYMLNTVFKPSFLN